MPEILNNDMKPTFSALIKLVGLIFLVYIAVNILSYILPDTSFGNTNIDIILYASASVTIITILVILFPILQKIVYILVELMIKNNKEIVGKASISFLLFLYTFPIYTLLAGQTGLGVEGAPLLLLNQISNWSLSWVGTLLKWLMVFWVIGIFIKLIFDLMPILNLYSDNIASKLQERIENTSAPVSKPSQCSNCGTAINKDNKFCPDCGTEIQKD
jgi:hypothetical protein